MNRSSTWSRRSSSSPSSPGRRRIPILSAPALAWRRRPAPTPSHSTPPADGGEGGDGRMLAANPIAMDSWLARDGAAALFCLDRAVAASWSAITSSSADSPSSPARPGSIPMSGCRLCGDHCCWSPPRRLAAAAGCRAAPPIIASRRTGRRRWECSLHRPCRRGHSIGRRASLCRPQSDHPRATLSRAQHPGTRGLWLDGRMSRNRPSGFGQPNRPRQPGEERGDLAGRPHLGLARAQPQLQQTQGLRPYYSSATSTSTAIRSTASNVR